MRTLNLDAGNEETSFPFSEVDTAKIGRFGKVANYEIIALICGLSPEEV